jgi:hypothetical protein
MMNINKATKMVMKTNAIKEKLLRGCDSYETIKHMPIMNLTLI